MTAKEILEDFLKFFEYDLPDQTKLGLLKIAIEGYKLAEDHIEANN